MPQEEGYSSAERSVREIAAHLGVSNIDHVCDKMRKEYVLEEWQLPALDSFQWSSLEAPIGLAVAVRQICHNKALALPKMTTTHESSILEHLDLHDNIMQSAILGLRHSFEEGEEKEDDLSESNDITDSIPSRNDGLEGPGEAEEASTSMEATVAEALLSSLPENEKESPSAGDQEIGATDHKNDDAATIVAQEDGIDENIVNLEEGVVVTSKSSAPEGPTQDPLTEDTIASPPLNRNDIIDGTEETPPRSNQTSDAQLDRREFTSSVSPTILLSAPVPNAEEPDPFHSVDKVLFPPLPVVQTSNLIAEEPIGAESVEQSGDSNEALEEVVAEDTVKVDLSVASDQRDEVPVATSPVSKADNCTIGISTSQGDDFVAQNEDKPELQQPSSSTLFHKVGLSMSERHSVSDQEMDEEDIEPIMSLSSSGSSMLHRRAASSLESLYYVAEDEHTVVTSNVSPNNKNKSKHRRRRSHQDIQIQSSSIGKICRMSYYHPVLKV